MRVLVMRDRPVREDEWTDIHVMIVSSVVHDATSMGMGSGPMMGVTSCSMRPSSGLTR
jgi:hypothetical protein